MPPRTVRLALALHFILLVFGLLLLEELQVLPRLVSYV